MANYFEFMQDEPPQDSPSEQTRDRRAAPKKVRVKVGRGGYEEYEVPAQPNAPSLEQETPAAEEPSWATLGKAPDIATLKAGRDEAVKEVDLTLKMLAGSRHPSGVPSNEKEIDASDVYKAWKAGQIKPEQLRKELRAYAKVYDRTLDERDRQRIVAADAALAKLSKLSVDLDPMEREEQAASQAAAAKEREPYIKHLSDLNKQLGAAAGPMEKKGLEREIEEAKRKLSFPSSFPTEKILQPAPAAPAAPPAANANDDIFSHMETAGFGREESVSMAREVLKGVRDKDASVPFGAGVGALIGNAFPEFLPQMATFARWLNGTDASAGAGAAQGAGGGAGAGAQTPQPGSEDRALLKQKIAELNEAGDLQTWYHVLAFVILAYLFGPQQAIVVFSNSRKRGALQAQIESLRYDIKTADERADRDEEWARRARAEAAKQAQTTYRGREEQAQAHQYRLVEQAQRAWLAAQRKTGTPEEKKYIDGLKGMFDRKMALAAAASRRMDEKQTKALEAEAEDIADELDQRAMQGGKK